MTAVLAESAMFDEIGVKKTRFSVDFSSICLFRFHLQCSISPSSSFLSFYPPLFFPPLILLLAESEPSGSTSSGEIFFESRLIDWHYLTWWHEMTWYDVTQYGHEMMTRHDDVKCRDMVKTWQDHDFSWIYPSACEQALMEWLDLAERTLILLLFFPSLPISRSIS